MTKTFLYIAGTKVPVLNDAPIPINYQIEDIRNPESTAVTHATTIELPSTKLLDEIFEFSYQPNIKFQTFNPNFRTTCEYWVNNQKIFEGSVKLNKCIWDKDKKKLSYGQIWQKKFNPHLIGFFKINNKINLFGTG